MSSLFWKKQNFTITLWIVFQSLLVLLGYVSCKHLVEIFCSEFPASSLQAVQPGEEKAPGRPYCSLPVPEGSLREGWRQTSYKGM